MTSKAENELLTRVEGDAPLGRMLRENFWMPFARSESLAPGGAPQRVRLLGTNLVAFRGEDGTLGLVDELCPHRRASLALARVEGCSLRCIYHGWRTGADGSVLEVPSEGKRSGEFAAKVRVNHYRVREGGGLLWAFLGQSVQEGDEAPELPPLPFMKVPAQSRWWCRMTVDCNWLQGVEGECDSSHLTFLHRTFDNSDPRGNLLLLPVTDYVLEEADFGMRLVAVRDMADGRSYVRVSSIAMPCDCWIPGGSKAVHFYVPAGDDGHSWRFNLNYSEQPVDRPPTQRGNEALVDAEFTKLRNQKNHYRQDRAAQKSVNFTGMGDNFTVHDSAATESMGHIFDRSREHLGVSDKAVIGIRRYLLDVIKQYQQSGEVPNTITDPARNRYTHTDTFAQIIEGNDWRGAFPHLTPTADQVKEKAATTSGFERPEVPAQPR